MPPIPVVFYQEGKAKDVPVLDWLQRLKRRDRKGFAKCVARIIELSIYGHELRRPSAAYLRDGIYELRAKKGTIQYRILYFFHKRQLAVLAHAIVKKGGAVPELDIEKAIGRKRLFESDSKGHTHEEDDLGGL